MPEVLILEDEPSLRELLVRGLAKLEGIDVVDAGTVAEALAIFRSTPPALIVSDLDLPDGSGLQLLGEIERSGLRIPVIFVSAYLDELKEWIPRRPDVEVRAKPIELETLRRLVRERLAAAKEGHRKACTVDEYVELACMGRQALLIKLEDDERLVGEILVRSGEVWSAVDAEGRGRPALERLRAALGRVELAPALDQIVLEPAIEESGDLAVVPEDELEEDIDTSDLEDELSTALDDVMERALEAVLRKDYATAIEAYAHAEALRPGDPLIQNNLAKLRALAAKA